MIEAEKERKIQRYKKEMRSYLKADIEGRINGEKAEIASTLTDDHQLNIAVTLLKNSKVYDRLLAMKTTRSTKQE
jgi:hypothetical protein